MPLIGRKVDSEAFMASRIERSDRPSKLGVTCFEYCELPSLIKVDMSWVAFWERMRCADCNASMFEEQNDFYYSMGFNMCWMGGAG
jgi:hypothetical protein